MNRSILSLAATFSLMGGTHAAVLQDNFESYSPLFSDMNGKGSWIVSNGNPAIPAEGPVAILDSYTWDGSLQSATVGGVASTFGGITSMFNSSFSVPLASSTFIIETAYTESTSGQRNNFQFVLTASSGNLLTLNFTPGISGQYNIGYTSAFAPSGAIGSVLANTSTQFQLNTFASGVNSVGYTLTNAGAPVAAGVLAGAAQSDVVNSFAVNWDSASNSGLGNNSITIDNISVVPEPTSAMMALLGASFALIRRRRA